MYSYATRGLGFLVRCATISRKLGQGSGGSPLFMINHRSSIMNSTSSRMAVLYSFIMHVRSIKVAVIRNKQVTALCSACLYKRY